MSNVLVDVRDISFSYKESERVLNGVSLKSWTSRILAVVGPSGCGKTTLIKLIISLLPLQAGTVKIFGLSNSDSRVGIPGPNLGYMPQNDCLPNDLLVRECLFFYAILNRMAKNIHGQVDFVLKQLELFEFRRKFVSSLSGGMRRRLSLAIALLHQPKLLILDEPTVGADPVLRNRIWEILNCVKEHHRSIIITTHYIEECKHADKIVFLRDGQVLCNGSSQFIKTQLMVTSLDEAFIKMCSKVESIVFIESDNARVTYSKCEAKSDCFLAGWYITLALLYRYFQAYLINPMALVIFLLNPIFTIVLLRSTSSDALRHLPVGLVIEQQTVYITDFTVQSLNMTPKCIQCIHPDNFRDFVDSEAINLIDYETFDDAIEDVERGKLYAVIRFSGQFADALFYRLGSDQSSLEDFRIRDSRPNFLGDLTNREVFNAIDSHLSKAFFDYWKASKKHLGLKPIPLFPIEIKDSLIGHFTINDHSSADVVMVGQMLNSFFSASLYLASVSLISELLDDSLQRYRAIGLGIHKIISAQIISNVTLSGLAAMVSLGTTSYLLKYPVVGSYQTAIAVILMQVLVGVLMGQLFAAFFGNEIFLLSLFLSLSYIAFAAEGSVIHILSQPYYMRPWSEILPNTLSIEALRAILFRGHALGSPLVLKAFLSNVAYIAVFATLLSVVMNKRISSS